MKAMQTLDVPFAAEARAHMARHDLPPESFNQVRGELARKAYMDEIAPYTRLLAEFAKHSTSIHIIHENGNLEWREIEVPYDQSQDAVNALKYQIGEIRARYEQMFSATPPSRF